MSVWGSGSSEMKKPPEAARAVVHNLFSLICPNCGHLFRVLKWLQSVGICGIIGKKEEGSDESFIGRNIDEIDGLIDDKYDDPELIIQAYRTIRQKKTINTSDVGKAMLTDPKVIEGRKEIARDEKNQRTDNSEKKPTDE